MYTFDDPNDTAWWAKDNAAGEFSAVYLAQSLDGPPRLLRIGLRRSERNDSGWGFRWV